MSDPSALLGLPLQALMTAMEGKGTEAAVRAAKRVYAEHGLEVTPFGAGNSKTRVPSTYRPVGPTCPGSCPWLGNGCYAQQNYVHLASRRASTLAPPSLRAAAACMVAARMSRVHARLHVSGDFLTAEATATEGTRLDLEYVDGLVVLARAVREMLPGRASVAWAYTHIPQEVFQDAHTRLADAGIGVLWSDMHVDGGAVVWPFDELAGLRQKHKDVRYVKCRAQLQDVTCAECDLCYRATQPEAHMTVVFDPHGASHARMRQRLRL